MKHKLKKIGNKKHKILIKKIHKYSILVKDGVLNVQDYLRLNRFYYNINIG